MKHGNDEGFNPVEWAIRLFDNWTRGDNALAIKEEIWESYGIPITLAEADEISACLPEEENLGWYE